VGYSGTTTNLTEEDEAVLELAANAFAGLFAVFYVGKSADEMTDQAVRGFILEKFGPEMLDPANEELAYNTIRKILSDLLKKAASNEYLLAKVIKKVAGLERKLPAGSNANKC
jgi:hypothetical protein